MRWPKTTYVSLFLEWAANTTAACSCYCYCCNYCYCYCSCCYCPNDNNNATHLWPAATCSAHCVAHCCRPALGFAAMIWLVRLCMLPTLTPENAGDAGFLRAPTQKADMGSRARARARGPKKSSPKRAARKPGWKRKCNETP